MKYSSTRRSGLLLLLLALGSLIILAASNPTADPISPEVQSDIDRFGLDDLREYITSHQGKRSLVARDEPINDKIKCETSDASPVDAHIRLNIIKLRKLGDKKFQGLCGVGNGIGSK